MADSKVLSTANNDFTTGLYKALFRSASGENLIFSPFSLHTVLGMVGLGARGNTREEIFAGLKFNEKDGDVVGSSYGAVINGFQSAASPETFTLLTANRVYSQTGYGLHSTFTDRLKTHFKADFEQLNFAENQASAKSINDWVETTTNGKIKDLISPDALNSLTRLVLVNGIYFKGFWEHKFDPESTCKVPFRLDGSKQVETDMMFITEKFPYGELPELDAEAVSLPYKGGRLSMIIILPKAVDGLGKIQENIGSILEGGKSLVGSRLEKSRDKVELALPKFKIEATLGNLVDVLKALGMKQMFSANEADFGAITDPEGDNPALFVSSVIQKAFIEVNEEGAEAAAATGVVMMMRCLPITIPFNVDHPFYFQIVDHENGDLVLFSGHCSDPTK